MGGPKREPGPDQVQGELGKLCGECIEGMEDTQCRERATFDVRSFGSDLWKKPEEAHRLCFQYRCSAILTIFQIEGASTAPVIRTTAFLSLICALMSLVYGCLYFALWYHKEHVQGFQVGGSA